MMTITLMELWQLDQHAKDQPRCVRDLVSDQSSGERIELRDIDFYKLSWQLARWDFRGCDFYNCDFSHQQILNCQFDEDTQFRGCFFKGVSVDKRGDYPNGLLSQLPKAAAPGTLFAEQSSKHETWVDYCLENYPIRILNANYLFGEGYQKIVARHKKQDGYLHIVKTDQFKRERYKGWYINLSIECDTEIFLKAVNIISVMLYQNFNYFKIFDINAFHSKHRDSKVPTITQSAQFCVLLEEGEQGPVIPADTLKTILESMGDTLKDSDIKPGKFPEKNIKIHGAFFSKSHDGYLPGEIRFIDYKMIQGMRNPLNLRDPYSSLNLEKIKFDPTSHYTRVLRRCEGDPLVAIRLTLYAAISDVFDIDRFLEKYDHYNDSITDLIAHEIDEYDHIRDTLGKTEQGRLWKLLVMLDYIDQFRDDRRQEFGRKQYRPDFTGFDAGAEDLNALLTEFQKTCETYYNGEVAQLNSGPLNLHNIYCMQKITRGAALYDPLPDDLGDVIDG